MKKVSIIVPVYNVENYLEECLDSLIGQTLKDIEIILVDDGSKDKSGCICDKYSGIDNRVKVLHQNNCGQSVARNVGLSMAEGEYILFVDSDDYIRLDACEVLYKEAKKHNSDIVNGDILNESDKILNSKFRSLNCDYKTVPISEFLIDKIDTETYDIVPWLYFVRREFLINSNIKFLEGYFYEDQLWTLQLLSLSGNALKIRFPYYYYRTNRDGSTTNNLKVKNGKDSATICNKMYEYIKTMPDSNMKKYYYIILKMSIYQFISVWSRLLPEDRKISYNMLRKDMINEGLVHNFAYKNLHKKIRIYNNSKLKYLFLLRVKYFLRKVKKL